MSLEEERAKSKIPSFETDFIDDGKYTWWIILIVIAVLWFLIK
jgi:hypothetical protein